jgi:hypothetical protein
MNSEKFKEALKFLNASNLSPQYFGISQSLWSKKVKGIDSKKGFDNSEILRVANGLEEFRAFLLEVENELRNEANN